MQLQVSPVRLALLVGITIGCVSVFGCALEQEDDVELMKLERGEGRLAALSAEALAKLPPQLLHLVKAEKLSSLSGTALAVVARKNKNNAVLVGKFALAARSKKQREDFLSSMKDLLLLPERVQRELAACMVHWFRDLDDDWKFERFLIAINTGSPLLAYLPREFLYALDQNIRDKFLYHLRAWRWTTSREDEWARKPRGLQRSWAELMVSAPFPMPLQDFALQEIFQQGFLLTGALPEELSQLNLQKSTISDKVVQLPLNPLQARAVFRTSFPRYISRPPVLSQERMHRFQSILPLLIPTQLRSLNLNLKKINNIGIEPIRSQHLSSWATARQLAYILLQQAEVSSSITSARNPTKLGTDGLKSIARLAYSLPISSLKKLITNNQGILLDDALGLEVIHALDDSPLSASQARIMLSNQMSHTLCTDNITASITVQSAAKHLQGSLLLALPASCVALAPVSSLSQSVLSRLLRNLPSSSPALVPLYLKIWAVLNREWVLQAIMQSKSPGSILNLIAPSVIATAAKEFHEAIVTYNPSEPLPRPTLALILGHWRKTREALKQSWRRDIIEVPALLPGLRCSDLRHLAREEGLPVLSALGQYLQDMKRRYPRDLQHCGLQALVDYLVTRVYHQEANLNDVPLFDTLEPAEIDAVGGYVFARIPADIIGSSKNWQHFIRAIGRLSVQELLEIFAAEENGTEKAATLTQLVLERMESQQHGLATLELLGNLIQFVPYSEHFAETLSNRAFKLWVEGIERVTDASLCVHHSVRYGFWHRAIIDAYGPTKNWSAGTLGSLGGFLSAVKTDDLDEIPQSAWIEAADVLNAGNGYTRRFMELCVKLLGAADSHQFVMTTLLYSRRLVNISNSLSETVLLPREAKAANATPTKRPMLITFTGASGLDLNVLPARERKHIDSTRHESTTHAKVETRDISSSDANVNLLPQEIQSSVHHIIHTFNTTVASFPPVRKLNCGALKMAGTAVSLVLDENDLTMLLEAGELQECLQYLGSLELSAVIIAALWRLIKKENMTIDMRDMGMLLSQVDTSIINKANLSDLDVVTEIGRNIENWHEVPTLTQLVLEANNASEKLSNELAGALGKLTCGLFDQISGISHHLFSPELFMKILAILTSTLRTSPSCPPLLCLRGLASIATEPLAMGDPASWSYEEVSGLGIIAAGLLPQQMEKLESTNDADSTKGLTVDAIRCMPTETLNAMSIAQLQCLSVTALDAVSLYQLEPLLPEKRDAIISARSPSLPLQLTQSSHTAFEDNKKSHSVEPVSSTSMFYCPNILFFVLCLFINYYIYFCNI